jgi:two-component system LytT family response regulator
MKKLRAFLVDDEPLALKRLSRLLVETQKVEIIGQTTEPLKAWQLIPSFELDVIFLDIQMPELTGFELLQKLTNYPPVIFTTAFDEFALKAFEVFSVDYLLKPIEAERLEKALEKLEKFISEKQTDTTNLQNLLASLANNSIADRIRPFDKIASRIGGKVLILTVSEIICFFAEDKITFAQNIEGKQFPIDYSLNELETKLDIRFFLRVHRNSIVNINFVEEVHGWFSGKVLIRLKGIKKNEIVVARDRVKVLKDFLGM